MSGVQTDLRDDYTDRQLAKRNNNLRRYDVAQTNDLFTRLLKNYGSRNSILVENETINCLHQDYVKCRVSEHSSYVLSSTGRFVKITKDGTPRILSKKGDQIDNRNKRKPCKIFRRSLHSLRLGC